MGYYKYPHPLYEPDKSDYTCCWCGDPIYIGDKYIENQYGNKFAHLECFYATPEEIEWLGGLIKIAKRND